MVATAHFFVQQAKQKLLVRLPEVPVHDGVDDGVDAIEEPGGAGHPDVGHGLGQSGVDQVGDEVGCGAHEETDEDEQHHSRQSQRRSLGLRALPPEFHPLPCPFGGGRKWLLTG